MNNESEKLLYLIVLFFFCNETIAQFRCTYIYCPYQFQSYK